MTLKWKKVGKRAYLAEDGRGGTYQVDRFLFSWHAVHTDGYQVKGIGWPPGVKHNLENAMIACQEQEDSK